MKRNISIALIICSIFTTILSFSNQSYALTTYKEVTKYHLDLGVIHIWGTGENKNDATYQDGLKYGTSKPFTASLSFPEEIKRVDAAYVLNSSTFQWNNYPTYTFNDTAYLTDKKSFDESYSDYVSNSISYIKPTLSGTHTINLSYTALLKSKYDYNLSEKLNMGGYDTIIALLGGEGKVKPNLQAKLEDGRDHKIAPGVFGFMFFVPIVIQYTVLEAVEIPIGGFIADLDVPASAKPGERFTVTDKSFFGTPNQFACTKLYYSVNGGTEKQVTGWKGTSLGESIQQSFPSECSVNYRIVAWNTFGDSDTEDKTINISNDHAIEINPALSLPDFTYEGHTELAKDESTFVVDGVDYSATRTYAENLADNSFKADSGTVGIHKVDSTRAECTFSQRGTYNITLNISADGGARASANDSIEVRKTPYIVDTLSGFQKQNRKQILTAMVATYPGKPLTDYSITLKDKKTGESFILTPSNPQQNTSTIKTRVVTMTQDLEKGFAYITAEFLTKTPSFFATGTNTQDFYYEINVTDSKGDTDMASKAFAVSPDLPPTAAISLDSAFLRNEGTNIAAIKAEDITVAIDGDSVERKWYYGATTAPTVFTDVSSMDGYKKLSFGTDKIVAFNKTGVGKFTTKLSVKELWTEPTLEEYVTDSDHLTGSATAFSDVQNVAPMVSLELLNATEKDILLIANNNSEYQTLLNNKTALQQALLANKIDGRIIIKKLIGDTPSDVTGITTKLSYEFPAPIWNGHSMTEEFGSYFGAYKVTTDSEKTYIAAATWINSVPNPPYTVHAYNPYSGEVWSYTTSRSESFSLGNDDLGKYLYLIYPNETVMLDKRTGAVAGTINIALPGKVILTDNVFFVTESNNLYAIDQNSLAKTLIDSNVSAISRVGGNLQYITKTNTGVIKNVLNIDSFSITKDLLVDTTNGKGTAFDYSAACIDCTGKIVLYKSKGKGTDPFNGIRIYSKNNTLVKEIAISAPSSDESVKCFAPLDESGRCNNVLLWVMDDDDRATFTGINLNTNKAASAGRFGGLVDFNFDSMFEVNGTSYFYYEGWYITGGMGYNGTNLLVKFNGATVSASSSGSGLIGIYDEDISASDRILTSLFGDNTTGKLQVKISSFPKTLAQETAELLGKFSDKFTFVGNVNTTADQIKATVDAPQPLVKINANTDGNLSLNNLSLTPGKKYNYEYEIKPLTEGSKNRITGIAASTGTITSSESFINDTLYVTDSYAEDFNNETINKFFTVNDNGRFVDGKYGSYTTGRNNTDEYSAMTFVVPNGKQAIVSFDYDFDFNATKWSGTNIFIDDQRMDEKTIVSPSPTSSSDFEETGHKIFYKILDPGTHKIETKVSAAYNYWSRVLMDNLRVDMLSTAPKTSVPSLYINDGEITGWLDVNGTFDIPTSILSYGAQQSYPYYGGFPSEVTDYDKEGRIEDLNYYQTVPSGYLQKGHVHLITSLMNRRNRVKFGVPGLGTIEYENTTNVAQTFEQWAWMGVKPAGTHTYTVSMNDPEDFWARMDVFNTVTYPVNAVTLTGNMAFNSDNTKYFFPKTTSTNITNLSLFIPKGEYLIKNLRVYYIENGQKIYLENKALGDVTQLPNWALSSGLTASNVSIQEEKKDDEYVKIYMKGEKVLYNIFYDDYEKDPSKTGYWVYSHIPWPPDTLHPKTGQVLTAPIDRFYLSGKYTVTHWEVDNTQRAGTIGDSTPYNKESNKVTMTFYVDGSGKAPWITYIKTNPSIVKENNSYTLAVGVDDMEKDTLTLETEVYLNGRSILADKKTGIQADAAGNYPELTINGLPPAKPGVYQVVCTVSDYSGTGIKAYKFTVVSEGRITGSVNHTEQWDENRKKYNLKRFSEEVNRKLILGDYIAMPTPRMRGTNVFWSGEKFILRAETEGEPTSVTVQLLSTRSEGGFVDTGYSAVLTNTGRKTAAGAEIWEGSLWNAAMINKWGRKSPEELTFRFTASYPGNMTKTHIVAVIVDSDRDYWQLHRLW